MLLSQTNSSSCQFDLITNIYLVDIQFCKNNSYFYTDGWYLKVLCSSSHYFIANHLKDQYCHPLHSGCCNEYNYESRLFILLGLIEGNKYIANSATSAIYSILRYTSLTTWFTLHISY